MIEIIIRILLFAFAFGVSYLCFGFEPISVAVCLGAYNFMLTLYELHIRGNIKESFNSDKSNLVNNHSNEVSKLNKKHEKLLKGIIKNNNMTIGSIVNSIESTKESITSQQQSNLLKSLISEIFQQINYTSALDEMYIGQEKYKANIKALTDFNYSIRKQNKGQKPIKGIKFVKLLDHLQNLEDNLNV